MACSYLNFYKYFLPFELLANNTIKNEIINLSSWHRSHKKKKDSLEIRVILLIFSLELEISGVAVQRILQNSEKWLWGCFSQFLLLWLWCQRFRGSSEDRYRSKRLSQILLVCLLKSQNILINNINNSERRSWKSSKSCTEKVAITGPWWVLSTMEVR